MVTIKCSVWEKHDLLKLLEYARRKKYEDFNNDSKMTKYMLQMDIETINRLKARVNGIYREDYFDNMSKQARESMGSSKHQEKDVAPKAEFFRSSYD